MAYGNCMCTAQYYLLVTKAFECQVSVSVFSPPLYDFFFCKLVICYWYISLSSLYKRPSFKETKNHEFIVLPAVKKEHIKFAFSCYDFPILDIIMVYQDFCSLMACA